MATLLTKVRRSVTRRASAVTLRRTSNPDGGFLYEVRASTDRRRLEHLGCCRAPKRDVVLDLLREADYQVDEVLEGRTWVCSPQESPA